MCTGESLNEEVKIEWVLNENGRSPFELDSDDLDQPLGTFSFTLFSKPVVAETDAEIIAGQ